MSYLMQWAGCPPFFKDVKIKSIERNRTKCVHGWKRRYLNGYNKMSTVWERNF